MSVAKISHTILDWRDILQLFMKEKIQLWLMWQNTILKVFIQIVHEKDFEFNCDHCGKNFTKVFNLEICIQTLHESHKTLDWILKITAVYKYKKFNCDQCGKYFARACNLKVLIQNVHEIYSWIELWTLWQIFHQSIQFVGNLSQNQNPEAQWNMIVILVENHPLNLKI